MDFAAEVVLARRVAHRLGLMDLMGHLGLRLPDAQGYLFTPNFDVTDIDRLTPADIVHLPADAPPAAECSRLPPEHYLDLAIFQSRPDVRAVLFGSPPNAMALAMANRGILPLTHTNAELAFDGVARCDIGRMITSSEMASRVARCLGDRRICHLPGIGMIVAGDGVLDVVRVADVYEQLAALTVLSAELPGQCRMIAPEEYRRLVAERPTEAIPSRDPRRYYEAVGDMPAVGSCNVTAPEGLPHGAERAAVAAACRTLYAQGGLVAFFEHVSHRIPDDDDRFLMSPAKHFGTMDASDVCVVSMIGDCPGLEGPYPPAPFRWFHRDVLAARPDIHAIVHTHDLYGRLFALKGMTPVGAFRNGFDSPDTQQPIFPIPTLMFTPENRRAAVALLAGHNSVHSITHGTDYLAPTIAEAVVRAIHHEQLCRAEYKAQQLGPTSGLAGSYAVDLAQHGPSWAQWFAYYRAGSPPRNSDGAGRDLTRR